MKVKGMTKMNIKKWHK